MEVRCRPRPLRRAAVATALGGVLIATGVARADDADTLRHRASEARTAASDLVREQGRAVLELYGLEEDLDRARRRAETLRRKSARAELDRRRAAARLVVATASAREAQERLDERLRELYMADDLDPLELLLSSDSLGDALAAIDGLEQVVAADVALLDSVETARTRLREAAFGVEQRRDAARSSAAAARGQARRLEILVGERTAYVAGLGRDLRLTEQEVVELEDAAHAASVRAAALNAAPASDPGSTRSIAAPEPAADGPGTNRGSPAQVTSPGDRDLRVEVTAYALVGTTATGVPTQLGVVAVDPAVIPLGTRMTIPGYGEGIAADTGSAVRGAIVDVWLPSVEEALRWGRRNLTITLHG